MRIKKVIWIIFVRVCLFLVNSINYLIYQKTPSDYVRKNTTTKSIGIQ